MLFENGRPIRTTVKNILTIRRPCIDLELYIFVFYFEFKCFEKWKDESAPCSQDEDREKTETVNVGT